LIKGIVIEVGAATSSPGASAGAVSGAINRAVRIEMVCLMGLE
jgi:hypothetical protein